MRCFSLLRAQTSFLSQLNGFVTMVLVPLIDPYQGCADTQDPDQRSELPGHFQVPRFENRIRLFFQLPEIRIRLFLAAPEVRD